MRSESVGECLAGDLTTANQDSTHKVSVRTLPEAGALYGGGGSLTTIVFPLFYPASAGERHSRLALGGARVSSPPPADVQDIQDALARQSPQDAQTATPAFRSAVPPAHSHSVLRTVPSPRLFSWQVDEAAGPAEPIEYSVPCVVRLFVQGVFKRDCGPMMGAVLFYSFVVVLMNLQAEFVYGLADPRIRSDAGG